VTAISAFCDCRGNFVKPQPSPPTCFQHRAGLPLILGVWQVCLDLLELPTYDSLARAEKLHRAATPLSSLHWGVCVRKFIRVLLLGLFGFSLLGCGICYTVWKASQQAPEFYEVALQKEPEQQKAAGDTLEQQVLMLQNEAREGGRWEALFTDEQINGWLATDLPEKFPHALPKGVSEPRVAIQPDIAKVACKYESKKVSTVFSMGLEISLTDEPNVIALRVRKPRAGLLPISINQILEHATRYANRSEIPVRWMEEDGDAVALVTIPAERKEFIHRRIRVETIELRDGEVYLAGRTEDSEFTSPPVVRQASYVKYSENVQR